MLKWVKFEKLLGISLIALLVGFATVTKAFADILSRGPAKLGTANDKNSNVKEGDSEGSRCNC